MGDRYDDDFGRSRHNTPSRQRRNDTDEATEIAMGTLNRTADGRQASYDTRIAMQRELDSARSQLKHAERQQDDMRRQMVQHREESAGYRAENIRVQDELRSLKARLGSTLDTQQDLLAKNGDMHSQVVQAQTQLTQVRDELGSKQSLAAYLQEHNSQVETELAELRQRSASTERTLETQLQTARDEVASLSARLQAVESEAAQLRSTTESLREDIRRKEADLSACERRIVGLESDNGRATEDIDSMERRVANFHAAQEELQDVLVQRDAQIDDMHHSIAILNEEIAGRDHYIARLTVDITQLEGDFGLVREDAIEKQRRLEHRLHEHKSRSKALSRDLKQLHKYVGKRELEVLELADHLEGREVMRTTVASSAATPLVDAARREGAYARLRAERQEAERLEALARARAARRSLNRSLNNL